MEEPVIARDATYFPAPEGLRESVRARLAATATERAPRRRAFPRWFATALACAVVAVLTWSLAAYVMRPVEDQRIAQMVVDAHVRSLMAPGHLADVVSTDQHTVKPWFAGKLDFSPPVADFSDAGFALTGGRLDYIDGRAAAAVTYKRRQHVVNFFSWPEKGVPDREPHAQSRQGYSLVGWSRSGMRFCVVADIAASELGELANLLRNTALR
jgi:anti-sigma factor RsiW